MAEYTSKHRPTSIYRYYDHAGILIYVGITSAGAQRNQQHNADKAWWGFVHSQQVDHFQSREEALVREADLIRQFTPPFNTVHNRSSEQVRAAYLFCREQKFFDRNPARVLQEVSQRLPLDIYRHEGGFLELRTRIEHAAVALKIELTPSSNVLQTRNGQRVGLITSITLTGPILRIVAPEVRRDVVFNAAAARVRQIGRKGPVQYEIVKVILDC